MNIQYTLNNYQIGSVIAQTPTDKIIIKHRLDPHHTLVVYGDITVSQMEFINKTFAKRGIPYWKGFKNFLG